MDITTEALLRNILMHEMDLDSNQVWLYNNDFTLPNTSNLNIAIEFLDNDIIYNNVKYSYDSSGTMYQHNHTGVREMVMFHLFSKSLDAYNRKVEVVQALNSLFSLQQQEKYQCRIFQIPDIFASNAGTKGGEVEKSVTLDGGIIMYNYHVTLFINTWYKKTKKIEDNGYDYFDSYETQVIDDEPTLQPIIDFTINES